MRRECTTTAEEPPFTATTEKPARSNEDRAQPKKVSYGFVAVDDCSVRKSWRQEVFRHIWGVLETMDERYLLTAAPADFERGVAPLRGSGCVLLEQL